MRRGEEREEERKGRRRGEGEEREIRRGGDNITAQELCNQNCYEWMSPGVGQE
jgi:hypothetical protein